LFYNWGFGLYGKVDVQMGIYMAVGIFVIQVLIAEIYFSKYKQGPIEALLKRFTYGKPAERKE
ncbi:MAG: DUF418 domain-containing protein, partial [Solibacillus isronensis]